MSGDDAHREIKADVMSAVQELLGMDGQDIDTSSPLMEMGLDSYLLPTVAEASAFSSKPLTTRRRVR